MLFRYWDTKGIDHFVPSRLEATVGKAYDWSYVYYYDPKRGVCLGGERSDEYALNYTLALLNPEVYPDSPKFTFIHHMAPHTDNPADDRTADPYYLDFVRRVVALPNTVLIVASDHGRGHQAFHSFFKLVVPKGKILSKEAHQALKSNQVRLFSFMDVHETLKHLMIGSEVLGNELKEANQIAKKALSWPRNTPNNVQSLLWPLPLRDCSALPIDRRQCLCVKFIEVPVDDERSLKTANDFVDWMNQQLIKAKHHVSAGGPCKNLSLSRIFSSQSDGSNWRLEFELNEGRGDEKASYNAAATYSTKKDQNKDIKVLSDVYVYMRESYQAFEHCRPADSDPHLCICD